MSLPLFFVCFILFVALHTPSGADSMVVKSRGSSLSLTDPLAEVRREAPDLAEIAEKVRSDPLCPISRAITSPVGRKRSASRSSSNALLSVKRESIFPCCDADDPIVVSDDETREEPLQVSKQVSKGNKDRVSGSVSPTSVRSEAFRGDGLVEASTKNVVTNTEPDGVGDGTNWSEFLSPSGVMPSREDLYYDEADREKLASWAEFPREVELAKRYEIVLRDRQRQELLWDPLRSAAGSVGKGRLRSRLTRRVGNFSEEEGSEGEVGKRKQVVNSESGRRGGRRKVLDSEDDGGDTNGEGVPEAGIISEPKVVLSSRAILGRRGKTSRGENMTPFLKPKPKWVSGGIVGVPEPDVSSEEEGSTVTLLASESLLKSVPRSSGLNGSSRLQSLSRRQADLLAELELLRTQQEEEERKVKEREERRKKEEEERARRQREEEERRAKEQLEKEQEEVRRSSSVSTSSPRARGNLYGVAAQSQIAVSIRPLRPSAAIVSIAARQGVLESAWLPLKGAIRPTVGDEIVSGRGRSATETAIRPMHMEFFLPRWVAASSWGVTLLVGS